MIVYKWRMVTSGECETLAAVPEGAHVTAVDDRVCLGLCEVCGEPICEGDDPVRWEDGILTCRKHGEPSGR